MTGEFHSHTYSDHPDCSCPHGIQGGDPHCQLHGIPPFTQPKEHPNYGAGKWIRSGPQD